MSFTVRNRMWTSTWPMSTLPKHLTVNREGLSVQHDTFCYAHRVFQDDDNCIPIRYRFDGKHFNLLSLRLNSRCNQR